MRTKTLKSKDRAYIGVRLDPHTKARLMAQAAKAERPLSWIVAQILNKAAS